MTRNVKTAVMAATISAVTWQTVHEHIVAGVFSSKKSSSALLVHE